MERILAGAFGIAFGGVGVALLGFMWLSPFDTFGSPPLFFRVFASFIAIPFVAVGGSMVYAAFFGKSLMESQMSRAKEFLRHAKAFENELKGNGTSDPIVASTGAKVCPHCAAPIGTAEISPVRRREMQPLSQLVQRVTVTGSIFRQCGG